jgi:tripartite-type tricarboxylate transporter receptor subunit TctC
MGTVSSNAINQTLYKKLPYDKEKGFAPISLIASLPNVLVVNPDKIKANNVAELIAFLKTEPGKHTYASSGVGTSIHLAGELLATKADIKITHVPYKGSSQAILDVVAGHVDMMFDNIPTAAQQVKAGKVKALAVTSLEKAALLPDVPTMASVIPGFDATSWHGLFAPPGTPPEIVEKLSREVQAIIAEPVMQEKLKAMGVTPVGNTSAEFQVFIDKETAKWADVIKAANVPLQ